MYSYNLQKRIDPRLMSGGVSSLPTIPCGLSFQTRDSNLKFEILLLHEKDEKVSSPRHREVILSKVKNALQLISRVLIPSGDGCRRV